jgi:hypothetical protein
MNEVVARGTILDVTEHMGPGQIEWELFAHHRAHPFFMPLDPYNPAHKWGQFGMDRAGSAPQVSTAQPADHTAQDSTSNTQSSTDIDTSFDNHNVSHTAAHAAPTLVVPPFPVLTPEIAASCMQKKDQAMVKRQAKRLNNAPPS